jgi:hypothetical protein
MQESTGACHPFRENNLIPEMRSPIDTDFRAFEFLWKKMTCSRNPLSIIQSKETLGKRKSGRSR